MVTVLWLLDAQKELWIWFRHNPRCEYFLCFVIPLSRSRWSSSNATGITSPDGDTMYHAGRFGIFLVLADKVTEGVYHPGSECFTDTTKT